MTSFYGMSDSYGCPRAMVAQRIGYEPAARPAWQDNTELLRYATLCEAVAAQQIKDLGYEVLEAGLCTKCMSTGRERSGFHVELETPLLTLLGHEDRRIVIDGMEFPVEIKSLGKNSWNEFAKNGFESSLGYAGQEACYLEAEKKPGIYWVLNRDNGKSLKYIINDFGHLLNLPKFEKLFLPITFNQVLENLNIVEIYTQSKELPEALYSEKKCIWCDFKYLCTKEDLLDTAKDTGLVTDDMIVNAGKMYKEGKELEDKATELMEMSKEILIAHAKKNGVGKFNTKDVKVNYIGMTQRSYVDEKKLKELVSDEIISHVMKPGKSWDNIRITVVDKND